MSKINQRNSTKNKNSKCDGGDEIWVTEFTQQEALGFREKVVAQSEEDPAQPIIVRINSYGGEVDSLAMMIETLEEVPNPIVTVVEGVAMSCGAILLSHGDLRWCGKYSRIMIHEASGGAGGDVHNVHGDAVELKRLNKFFMGLLAKNCGLKGGYDTLRKVFKSRDAKDMYMTPEEALEFGIIDAIGVPKVSHALFYDISTTQPKKFKVGNSKTKKHKKTDKINKKTEKKQDARR